MNDYVDIYYERIDQAFWARPLNAISNAVVVLCYLEGCDERSAAR